MNKRFLKILNYLAVAAGIIAMIILLYGIIKALL